MQLRINNIVVKKYSEMFDCTEQEAFTKIVNGKVRGLRIFTEDNAELEIDKEKGIKSIKTADGKLEEFGGEGSGHHGHAGTEGSVGGSKPGKGGSALGSKETAYGVSISDKESRNTLTQKSLDRIKKTIAEEKNSSPDAIDSMVGNTNQNLTNKQIAAAYNFLGIQDKMKSTTSVKRANKG